MLLYKKLLLMTFGTPLIYHMWVTLFSYTALELAVPVSEEMCPGEG